MTAIYWYGDSLVPKENVSVSPDDRGYYFGDGIYEVFRVYGGRPFEAEAHVARLLRTAAGVRLALPFDADGILDKLEALIRANSLVEGNVYMQFTRGAAPRSHPFPQGAEPIALGYCTEVGRPIEAMEAGIRLASVPDIRWLRCDYKTLNLLPNVLAKQEALDAGAADAVLHRDGTVTECSASNLMIVKDGVVVTHPANHLILHGVTRGVVLRLAREADIPVQERPFTLEELYAAEEAFITGTTVEVTPVIAADGRDVGSGAPGPLTRRLQSAFASAIGL